MPRGRKKENTPPFLSGYVASEQKNVQRNINVHLYLSTGRHVAADSVARRPDCGESNAQGEKRAAFSEKGSNDLQQYRVVQTNLSCPYWPFREATGDSLSKRQSNLVSKLQRGTSGVSELTNEAPTTCVSLCSRSEKLSLKGNPPSQLSSRSRNVSRPCGTLSNNRMGSEAQDGPKPRQICASRIRGRRGDGGDSSSPAELSVIPAPGSVSCRCLPTSPGRSDDSFHRGPGLTLDHLNSSTSAESSRSSAALQILLKSSQTSADLHSSIQQFKQEAASMGALGSSPWESKHTPLPCRTLHNPQVSVSTVLTATERLAAEESYVRQASVKWRAPFPKDWGGISTAGKPISVIYRCPKDGLYAYPTEALNQSCFHGGVDLTSLALRGEDRYSETNIRYLECGPGGVRQTLGRTGSCSCSKTRCHRRAADPEGLASDTFRRSELSLLEHPLSLLSFDSLEVIPGALSAEANLGTPGCGSLAVQSPVGQFRRGTWDSETCEAGGKPGEDSGAPALPTEEHVAFLPHWKLSSLGEHRQAAGIIGEAVAGRSANSSLNSLPADCWSDAENDQGGGSSVEQTWKRTRVLYDEESNNGMDDKQKEDLEGEAESMETKSNRPLPQRVDPQLEKYFVAWRDHVSRKMAAAQALYEHQLLRKGLSALRWAVQLRKIQAGFAQRNHILTVLAASFRKWQDALTKQRKASSSQQQEAASPARGPLATPFGGGGVRMSPNPCRLPVEHLEDAARYSRAEGILWAQLRRQQGGGETCRKAATLREVRRLAAAFRLWRLQQERLEKEEIRAQEVLALLEKKRLAGAFEAWRSRYRAVWRSLPLVAQVQRALLSRCFQAWKSVANREALCRHARERLRLKSLRAHFHQWALMMQVREKARKTLLELWALRRMRALVNIDAVAKVPAVQARWYQKSGADALDGFYRALTLQQVFRTWESRWRESQLATAFRRVSERRLLREALGLWRRKTLCLPLELGPGDLAEDLLLASPDSEESSLSSGFHSNVPAPPLSGDSLDKESSLEDSSQASISSSTTTEDSGPLPHHGPPSPSRSPPSDSEDLAAAELLIQAPFPLGNGRIQNRRQMLAKCFEFWSARTVQNLKAEQHRKQALLCRAFASWSVAAVRHSTCRKTLAWLENARGQRLLASCFGRWKAEFLRTGRQRKDECPWRRPAGRHGAMWRWRKAIRGSWALRFSSVNQASSYWTRAATFHQCIRQQSSLIGGWKFLKAPLLWPGRRRRMSGEAPPPGLATHSRLTSSSFRVWLMLYRCQSKTLGAQWPPMGLEAAGQATGSGRNQETRPQKIPSVVARRWLGRKYLTRWRQHVLLRRFQRKKEKQDLSRAWEVWKDACQTELAVQALVRQRLAQWSWAVWRRRCLQNWVAERFLAGEEKLLLEQAFGKWRQLTSSHSEGRGDF